MIWSYRGKHPCLEILLRTPFGKEHHAIALLDTGFSGDIIVPNTIYDESLELNKWEKGLPKDGTLADGSKRNLVVSEAIIFIPRISIINGYNVSVYKIDKEGGVKEIIIGVSFINKFKFLLDGPAKETRIV